MILFLPQIR